MGVEMHPLRPVMSTHIALLFHHLPSQEWFDTALTHISRFYRFMDVEGLEELLGGRRRLRGRCLVTFDDGGRSFYDHALPVLERRGIPALLFVSPRICDPGFRYWFDDLDAIREGLEESALKRHLCRHLGLDASLAEQFTAESLLKSLGLDTLRGALEQLRNGADLPLPTKRSMSEEQLLEVARSPVVELGAHSLEHPILANEDHATARQEILGSVSRLAKIIGRPVRSFAYPNGNTGLDYGPREFAVLREAGIRLAFSADSGFVSRHCDPLDLPRVGLAGMPREGLAFILAKLCLAPVWEPLRSQLGGATERQLRERILREGIMPRLP